MIPSDEQIAESRARLNIPDDWEWYECANQCGDLVWVPPEVGDVPIAPVCTVRCLHAYLIKKEAHDPPG